MPAITELMNQMQKERHPEIREIVLGSTLMLIDNSLEHIKDTQQQHTEMLEAHTRMLAEIMEKLDGM